MESEKNVETSTVEARNINLTRAAVYAFLSRVFKLEVDQGFIESIAAIEPVLELLSESGGSEELKEGNHLLLEFMKQVNGMKSKERSRFMTDLAAEYADLFRGVGSKPVHLLESMYLKDRRYEQPYHEVLAAYKSLGFEKEKSFLEDDDHVAIELEFMGKL